MTQNYSLQDCLPDIPKDLIWYYYRLDFDLTAGTIFKEEVPHLHLNIKGVPRIAFPLCYKENPLISFIEFIYLNHFYDDWHHFVNDIIKSHEDFSEDFRDLMKAPLFPSLKWEDIKTKYSDDMAQLKIFLCKYKSSFNDYFKPLSKDYNELNYFHTD